MKRNIIFLVILPLTAIGLLLRVWNLKSNPPELFSDEIRGILSAKSMIESGKDINGKPELYFYNRLELYPPVYGYLAALTSYAIGNDTLAVRLPAAISGTITIALVFYLTLLLFKNTIVAATSAFVITFAPWAIHFSRVGWEPGIFLPFIILPIILFFLFLHKKKNIFLFLSFIFFAFAVYTTRSSEFLSPLFMVILLALNFREIKKHYVPVVASLAIFSILIIPYLYISATQPLMHERADRIFTFAGGVNKTTLGIFVRNYYSHLTPSFLFINGDPNLRQGAGTGVLFWSFLPLIILGLVETFKNIPKKEYKFLLLWFLVFPLGGSLTNDGVPHATRTLIGVVAFAILAGLGARLIWEKGQKLFIIFSIILFIAFSLELSRFLTIYFKDYPINSQAWWEYGQSQIFSIIKTNTKGGESLCLLNTDYWHEETLTKYYLGINNNYKIIYDPNNPDCFSSQILVLKPQVTPPLEYVSIKTVNSLEGNPIWTVYSSLKN